MKKSICLCVAFLVAFSYYGASQCFLRSKSKEDCKSKSEAKTKSPSKSFSRSISKSVSNAKWIPFAEASYQAGLCGEGNPIAVMTGAEKRVSKHFSVSGDVFFWKTAYETYCCDTYSVGDYTAVIPSVKFRFDPGKQYKGFFVGAGLGYAIARDRGTEQPYTYEASTGKNNVTGTPTQGNWDFNTIAPSFQWGLSFKAARLPVSIVNTNYFGKSTEGWGPISTGVGLRLGLSKVPKEKKSCGSSRVVIVEKSRSCIMQKSKSSSEQKSKSKSNSSQRSGCTPKIKI